MAPAPRPWPGRFELLAWPATVPAERATDALEVARGSSGGGGGRQHDVAVSERIADEPSPAQRWFALARRAPMARSGLRESGNGQGSRIAVARRASRFVHNPPPTKRRVRLHS